MTHPTAELNDLVHQRVRLGILAVLVEAGRADFVYIRDALDLTDGNLSRHLQTLEEAGYVRIEKGYEGKRPRTSISLTGPGRREFHVEITALKGIVRRFDQRSKRP